MKTKTSLRLVVAVLVATIFCCVFVPTAMFALDRQNFSVGRVKSNTAEIGSLYFGSNPFSGTQGTLITATGAELNSLDLSTEGIAWKVKRLEITTDPTGAEQSTAWELPAKAIVYDVFVDVTTAEATGSTKTMDVGTDGSASNDADGFLNDIDVSTTGIKRSSVTLTGNAYFESTTRGVLLGKLIAGSGTDDRGLYYEFPDVTSGGDAITITAGSNDWEEFRGSVYVVYAELYE